MTSERITPCRECATENQVSAVAGDAPRCGGCAAPLPWFAVAGDDDFAEVVEASPVPVVVDFWAEWCGPCQVFDPVLVEVANELAGGIKVVDVDVDQAPKLADRFRIQAIPLLLLVRHGEVTAQRAGSTTEPILRAWIEESLALP